MAEQQTVRWAQQQFKLRGLSIMADALKLVAEFIDNSLATREESLEQVLSALEKKNLKSAFVKKAVVQEIVEKISGLRDVEENPLQVVNAFDMPKYRYDTLRKIFYRQSKPLTVLPDGVDSQVDLYRDRLMLLQQRLLRNKLFTKPILDLKDSDYECCELTPLQSLIGVSGTKYVMGTISQLEDGKFFLEDFTGSIPLDLSEAATTVGFFTENSIVVAEGELQPNGTFLARALGFPPLETKEETLTFAPGIDFFGAGCLSTEDYERLKELEVNAVDHMFVVISELWLDVVEADSHGLLVLMSDQSQIVTMSALFGSVGLRGGVCVWSNWSARHTSFSCEHLHEGSANTYSQRQRLQEEQCRPLVAPIVMEKFRTVLEGYEGVDVVPSLFLLMGNFSSRPCSKVFHEFADLRKCFSRLGAMIAEHPRIAADSSFIFVPGPTDIGPSVSLPRPPVWEYFAQEVKRHVPKAIFASNPVRIRFLGQEIVAFREDILWRMRRACVVPPSQDETTENFHHLAITMLQQSHLCPLPLIKRPIYADYDHALRLYPVPDVLIIADRSEQKEFLYEGINCFNPGSFAYDGTFAAYRPASCHTEEAVELSSL